MRRFLRRIVMMRVLIVSGRPEAISDYLKEAGHEVRECLSTDMAGRMAGIYAPDVVIFLADVPEVPPVSHRDALKALQGYRIVLIGDKADPLVTFAAALGVKDFAFFPANPAAILYCVNNPTSPGDAADLLDKTDLGGEKFEGEKPRKSGWLNFLRNRKRADDQPEDEGKAFTRSTEEAQDVPIQDVQAQLGQHVQTILSQKRVENNQPEPPENRIPEPIQSEEDYKVEAWDDSAWDDMIVGTDDIKKPEPFYLETQKPTPEPTPEQSVVESVETTHPQAKKELSDADGGVDEWQDPWPEPETIEKTAIEESKGTEDTAGEVRTAEPVGEAQTEWPVSKAQPAEPASESHEPVGEAQAAEPVSRVCIPEPDAALNPYIVNKGGETPRGEINTTGSLNWGEELPSVPSGEEQTAESEHENWEIPAEPEYQGAKAIFFQARKAAPEKNSLRYLPHQLIAVWSPDGWAKSYTAFNLAALAAAKGFDTALVNYDLLCLELDTWFGVKQTGIGDFEENSAGVMTFGEGFKPELASRFLKKRAWGIKYLPAGNKLGNICAPGLDTEALEQTLKIVYQRNTGGKPAVTIVDAGRSYEQASTMAALRQAAVVLIPTDGSPAIAEVTKRQIEELNRLGYSPRFIELLFTTPGRKVFHFCQERCSVAFDWMTYLIDRAAMKPQCLRVDGRRAWEGVLNQLAPTGAGNVFREL
jgi:Mrp family chromosome partitioning ATPase